jgi:ferredoxin
MAHVVTESCINCKYTDCASICPVGAFHEAGSLLVINPDECIDCRLCVTACRTFAIYAESEVPENQQMFIELNRRLSTERPVIIGRKPPAPDAEYWRQVSDKRHLI